MGDHDRFVLGTEAGRVTCPRCFTVCRYIQSEKMVKRSVPDNFKIVSCVHCGYNEGFIAKLMLPITSRFKLWSVIKFTILPSADVQLDPEMVKRVVDARRAKDLDKASN